MLEKIDSILNKITMYRVVLYYLIILWLAALAMSFFGLLPYAPLALAISLGIILVTAWGANTLFAYVFKVPANVESIYITVLILALIITPAVSATEYIFLGWAAIIAMASKYIFAIKHKHVFNPAALAVAVTAATISGTASWWVGTLVMAPFVLAGGLLVVRKIIRADLTLAFFVSALVSILAFSVIGGGNILTTLSRALFYSPLLFFTFVMITEPLTTPPSRWLRILYGTLVGFLFAPQVHIGSVYLTPELALLIGNVFSYLVSPKSRLTLSLKRIDQVAVGTAEFVFEPDRRMRFRAGQYLEWTLGHGKPDSRGNRRYFTIASSPTEKELRLGVRFYPKPSSYKMALANMQIGDTLIASQLSGDFVMPRNNKRKLAFIAGGIGVTPFRSMVKYLVDTKQNRDVGMFYANKTIAEIAYKDFFDSAVLALPSFKVTYTIDDTPAVPVGWSGERGYVNANMIRTKMPDFLDRHFYISGPRSMVTATERLLKSLGVPDSQIKTDFFPGFA